MKASLLLDTCLKAGIDFFTGVPDSLLNALCHELFLRYGTEGDTHVVAHNEGGAVGLCAGHYLATGRPGLCYMQNSGLGNAVNPALMFDFPNQKACWSSAGAANPASRTNPSMSSRERSPSASWSSWIFRIGFSRPRPRTKLS